MTLPAKDVTVTLHIGLHKTASSYIQNVLSARRYDLLEHGVLYPNTGQSELGASTREGAQSGHAVFTRRGPLVKRMLPRLLAETSESISNILLTSENFTLWHRESTAAEHLAKFEAFRTVKVVLVLRRQDTWIESYYKQIVDAHRNFESRSFQQFLEQEGPLLLDFYHRFAPWRDLVGPDNFHVLSYDDAAGAGELCRRVLEVAGAPASLLDEGPAVDVPRYDSVRAIDTVGLRVLNSLRVDSRDERTAAARSIYEVAPEGDIDLLTPEIQEGIQRFCAPINERIEAEWFTEPVPGFRFGKALDRKPARVPSGPEMSEYLDRVLALGEAARARSEAAQALLDETAAVGGQGPLA